MTFLLLYKFDIAASNICRVVFVSILVDIVACLNPALNNKPLPFLYVGADDFGRLPEGNAVDEVCVPFSFGSFCNPVNGKGKTGD